MERWNFWVRVKLRLDQPEHCLSLLVYHCDITRGNANFQTGDNDWPITNGAWCVSSPRCVLFLFLSYSTNIYILQTTAIKGVHDNERTTMWTECRNVTTNGAWRVSSPRYVLFLFFSYTNIYTLQTTAINGVNDDEQTPVPLAAAKEREHTLSTQLATKSVTSDAPIKVEATEPNFSFSSPVTLAHKSGASLRLMVSWSLLFHSSTKPPSGSTLCYSQSAFNASATNSLE